MQTLRPTPTAIEPAAALPAALDGWLGSYRTAVLAGAGPDARVVDLSTHEGRAAVREASTSGGPIGSGDADLVVSCCDLTSFADLGGALRGVARLLAPNGHLELVEPVPHTTRGHLVWATAWSRHPATAGRHLERDVVRTVWSTGLSISDLERFEMTTTVWPYRHLVRLRARHIPGVRVGW